MKCFYCYDANFKNSGIEFLPLSYAQDIAEQAKALGVESVSLLGGEPFLHPNWFDISQQFCEKKIRVSFSTNGTLITSSVAKKLACVANSVQISLDGNNETVFDISQTSGVFTKVMGAVEELKYYKIPVSINCVVGKHNLPLIYDF